MTVQEYADKHGLSVRTVYRRIENGKIDAKKIDGIWVIQTDDIDKTYTSQLERQIEILKQQNEYLQQELTQLHTDMTQERNRHDTIVLNLTKQVEQKILALEDKSRIIDEMQNRSWWRRVKMAFGFSVT